MENRISQALTSLFERHRIVFWYDAKKELRGDYEMLDLPGVQKIELTNNEFGVKHRILREEPDAKFLLYREGPQLPPPHNWLLDVQLAHTEFRTDQVALWLSELELPLEFVELAQEHSEFFRAAKRKDALRKRIKSGDDQRKVRQQMLAVCARSDARMDAVVITLLEELADGRDEKIKLIDRCHLTGFLWEQMARYYGYQSDTPGMRDFVIELFKSCYAMDTNPDGEINLTSDAQVFLSHWKDSRSHEACFEILSSESAEVLGIEHDLAQRDFRDLIELDYFELVDKKIISDLVAGVSAQTVSNGDVAVWIRQRRQGHWYEAYRHLYEAIGYAAQFIHALEEADLSIEGMHDGVQRYSQSWFRLDQWYRKFTYHARKSGNASLLGRLSERIENLYSNNYLLKVNDRWQAYVDSTDKWSASPTYLQRDFFDHWAVPFLKKRNKVCVIISDAMRYEVGDELLSRIRQEDRYDAELEPALSMLPSYTQLGMAALLPNKELTLADNETSTVHVDGKSSQGTANRVKILQQALSQPATAIKADELMGLNKEDCRTLLKNHDVVYVYHNRIDAVGDKRDSEERVFEAVEETLQDLIQLVKKLTAANASNLLVTSDHGFIYQNRPIDESDFSGSRADGRLVLFRDRRFVLGKGLKESPSLCHFQSSQLGLAGDVEVQIPKSINRMRLQGSGSRFVHGGASLQEVVIPVLKINKKRRSDVSTVEVEVVRSSSSTITSSQLGVVFYQTQAATDKVRPRILRAGIYTQEGVLISDRHELNFDLPSENPRERELPVRFVLKRGADEVNNEEVVLKLEEKLIGTSHHKEYKSVRYLMRRSFTGDFDF